MNNIQYPLEGSSGWGDAVNSNFHAFEDGIDDLNSNKTEILSTIGDETMGTTATTLKGAIAEHSTQLNENTQNINNLQITKQDKIEDSGWVDFTYIDETLTNWTSTWKSKIRKVGNCVTIQLCFKKADGTEFVSNSQTLIGNVPSLYKPDGNVLFTGNGERGTSGICVVSGSVDVNQQVKITPSGACKQINATFSYYV